MTTQVRWSSFQVAAAAREINADCPVPAPLSLVVILQAHAKEFGTAVDGRLLANERGGVLRTSGY